MLFNPVELVIRWYKKLSKTERLLLLLILAAFLVRVIYVFYLTDYKEYLISDMNEYWNRALERYNGDVFRYSQWASWAPFYHYYLAFVFWLSDLINLSNYRLEFILLLGIILSVISVYFFHRLASHFIQDNIYSFLATAFYAFSYPLTYLNTFVLSENLAIPLLIISISSLLTHINSKRGIFLSGLLLALSICTRPALSLLALPFFLYVIFHNKVALAKSLSFALGFLLIITLVIQENIRVSDGKLKALAANGGVNFFVQQCKVSHVRSYYEGYFVELRPPLFVKHPHLAKVNIQTNEPFHKQDHFYRLGLDCIKKDPEIWLENFTSLKTLFVGPLFPRVPGCFGSKFLKIISDYMIIFMASSFFTFYFLIRDKKVDLKKSLFLFSVPFILILMNYFFIVGQRQFIPAYFVIYISFFTFLSNLKKYKNLAIVYFAIGLMLSLLRGSKL